MLWIEREMGAEGVTDTTKREMGPETVTDTSESDN